CGTWSKLRRTVTPFLEPRSERLVHVRSVHGSFHASLKKEKIEMNRTTPGPQPSRNATRILALATVLLLFAAGIYLSHSSIGVKAADHRDSPTADANPEGDITDMFAFLDPNDTTQLVLIMNVNPFSVPAEAPSYTFSNEFLYQFKFGNDKGPLDDLVIQAKFNGVDTTKCASGQWIKVYGPTRP